RGDASGFLSRGDNVQGERRFTRTVRAVNFDDAAARNTADADRRIQAQTLRRYRTDIADRAFAQTHYRALAEFLFYLLQSRFYRLTFVHAHKIELSPFCVIFVTRVNLSTCCDDNATFHGCNTKAFSKF